MKMFITKLCTVCVESMLCDCICVFILDPAKYCSSDPGGSRFGTLNWCVYNELKELNVDFSKLVPALSLTQHCPGQRSA